MSRFPGFTEAETFTLIPDSLVRALLREIPDIAEFKVTLFAVWHLANQTGTARWLQGEDIAAEVVGLSADQVVAGLDRAVARGTLLHLAGQKHRYVLNSPGGRALASSSVDPAALEGRGAPPLERPNAFRLFEENIGPLTPLIADALKDATEQHPTGWLEDAIRESARQNKRSLSYIQAILRRWKEDGRAPQQDRRSTERHDWESLDRRIDDLRRRSEK
jgi:DnaD/phage-associated family protein